MPDAGVISHVDDAAWNVQPFQLLQPGNQDMNIRMVQNYACDLLFPQTADYGGFVQGFGIEKFQ